MGQNLLIEENQATNSVSVDIGGIYANTAKSVVMMPDSKLKWRRSVSRKKR